MIVHAQVVLPPKLENINFNVQELDLSEKCLYLLAREGAELSDTSVAIMCIHDIYDRMHVHYHNVQFSRTKTFAQSLLRSEAARCYNDSFCAVRIARDVVVHGLWSG